MDRRERLDDPEESLRLAFEGFQAGLWTNMPGIITKVDLTKCTAEIQPAIQGQVQDEKGNFTYVNLPLLVDVPIMFPKAGGFMLSLPIKAGDEVLVFIASRCIDAWWQSGKVSVPIESRMHDLSDGFCFPGPFSTPKVYANISSTKAQLRNEAGTVFIEIDPTGKIGLTSTSTVEITAPATKVTGNFEVTGTTTLKAVAATGLVAVTGNITATGSIVAGGAVGGSSLSAGGLDMSSHKHTGVTVGGGTTGGPVP